MASKDNLYLRVITPDGSKFSDYVQLITLQTKTEGYEGIMKKHIPLCSEVAISQCLITTVGHERKLAIIVGGFLYNDGDEMKVLTPFFSFLDEIDREQIENKITKIQKQIDMTTDKHRIRTLNVQLRNEQNKLKAIDDVYSGNMNAK